MANSLFFEPIFTLCTQVLLWYNDSVEGGFRSTLLELGIMTPGLLKSMRKFGCLFAVYGIVLFCSCSTEKYKAEADEQTYGIIDEVWRQDYGEKANYRISDVQPSPNDLTIEPNTIAGLVTLPQAVAIATAQNREYQRQKEQLQATVTFELPQTIQTLNPGLRGYSFFGADSKEIVQFRIDGFTFNRLAPYVSWEDMYSKAAAAWQHYRLGLPDAKVTRLATRFLNRILLPINQGQVELDDYFNVGAKDPHDKGILNQPLLYIHQ